MFGQVGCLIVGILGLFVVVDEVDYVEGIFGGCFGHVKYLFGVDFVEGWIIVVSVYGFYE